MKRFIIAILPGVFPIAIMVACGYLAWKQDAQIKLRQETIDAECSSGQNSVYRNKNRLIRNDSAFEVKMEKAIAAEFNRQMPFATVSSWQLAKK